MERVRLLMSVGVFSCSGSGLVSSTYPTGIGGGVLYNVAIYWSGQPTREMLDRACVVSYKENPDVNKTNKTRLVYFGTYGSNDGNHSTKYNKWGAQKQTQKHVNPVLYLIDVICHSVD